MSMVELRNALVNKLPGWPLLNITSKLPAYNLTSNEVDIALVLSDYRRYNIQPLFSLSIGIKPYNSKLLIIRVINSFSVQQCYS